MINFILPYNQNEYKNWCFEGPITYKIYDNFSYTIFPNIKSGVTNYMLIEPTEALKVLVNNPEYLIIKIKDFLIKNDIKLILSSIADPPNAYIYKLLMDDLKKLELSDKIIVLSSNMALKHDNVYCVNFFVEDFIHNKHILYGETDLGYTSEEIRLDELDNFRNKKFLSFNRTVDKEHRYSLYHDYLTHDFSDSYFSFLTFEGIHCDPYQTPKLKLQEYASKIPIELDTSGFFNFRIHNTIKKELFLDSCIHIITETSFSGNELFVSEKVLKPIVNYQPFIALGPVNYLKELKRLGFKTFSDFWDESYDDIEDPKERYLKVSNLILELNSKSIEEFNELYQKTKDIVIFNQNYLNNLELNDLDTFLKKL